MTGDPPHGSACATGARSGTAQPPISSSSIPPASGATRPTTSRGSFPDGIDYVMVNGTLVVDGGAHTGATPGRALRHARD